MFRDVGTPSVGSEASGAEVLAGDTQGLQDDARGFRVERAHRDAGDDLGECELDGGDVFEGGEDGEVASFEELALAQLGVVMEVTSGGVAVREGSTERAVGFDMGACFHCEISF